MSGVFGEMSGEDWRAFRWGLLGLALFVFSADTVNVFTVVQDRAAGGRPIAAWEPAVWEYTSGAAWVAFSWLIYATLRLAPPVRGGWLRFAILHLVAAVLYSALHVSAMALARSGIYAALGGHYGMSLSEFPYECRKDLLSYATTAGMFWLSGRLAAPKREDNGNEPPVFDIRDGARIIRARVQDIVWASSAGNYVEFALADGRKPLMRCTLASVERALEPHGFVRTHRSWLVNAARVGGLKPDGSGDFTVELDTGGEVPLSRRFPEAHRRLRTAAS